MTKVEIIDSLFDQARDKELLANNDPDNSIFADDANALREAAELLKAGPEWISVKDRLPESEGDYLCAFDDGYVSSAEWIDGEWDLWVDSGKVTHWMPLPEPPAQDEGDTQS